MTQTVTGISSLMMILAGMLGDAGFSLGVPPLPETPTLAKIAPEQCVLYVSSAGTATPDPKSANQTEQLLAEPEVQKLLTDIENAIKTGFSEAMNKNGSPAGISSDEFVNLAKLVIAKPWAVYIASMEMGPQGPALRGGIAVKFDDEVEKVKAQLERLAKTLPPPMVGTVKIGDLDWQTITPSPGVTIAWGFEKKYFLAALGDGEMEAMMKRARGEPPQWLTKLRKDLPVERLATIGYLNVKTIRETLAPMANPKAATAMEALGVNNVRLDLSGRRIGSNVVSQQDPGGAGRTATRGDAVCNHQAAGGRRPGRDPRRCHGGGVDQAQPAGDV